MPLDKEFDNEQAKRIKQQQSEIEYRRKKAEWVAAINYPVNMKNYCTKQVQDKSVAIIEAENEINNIYNSILEYDQVFSESDQAENIHKAEEIVNRCEKVMKILSQKCGNFCGVACDKRSYSETDGHEGKIYKYRK